MWIPAQYEKEPGEALIHEWELDHIEAQTLARIFGGEPWDETVYEVGDAERAQVEEISGERLHPERYAYFIEAIASGDDNDVITLDSGQRIYLPPRILPGIPRRKARSAEGT
jgi:hypothetical protein